MGRGGYRYGGIRLQREMCGGEFIASSSIVCSSCRLVTLAPAV
jgi:hypothetical protein